MNRARLAPCKSGADFPALMSPYEIRLRTENFRRLGLFAVIPAAQSAALDSETIAPAESEQHELEALGVLDTHLFVLHFGSQSLIFSYARVVCRDIREAKATLSASRWLKRITSAFSNNGTRDSFAWRSMELINVIGDCEDGGIVETAAIERLGFISTLKPEAELSYRTLHQTNWPGVVDQMLRSRYRCWITFLLEHDERLLLFTYAEYTGCNRAADDEAMNRDPVTQRWWKHTEPCLQPIDGGRKSWTPLKPVCTWSPCLIPVSPARDNSSTLQRG